MTTPAPPTKIVSLPIPPDAICAEQIIAPLHDSRIAASIGVTVQPRGGMGVAGIQGWCWYTVSWQSAASGETAATVTVPCHRVDSRFDQLIACFTAPQSVAVSLEVCLDEIWRPVLPPTPGRGRRSEVTCPLNAGELSAVRITCTPTDAGAASVGLHWLGIGDSVLKQQLQRGRMRWPQTWPGLLIEPPTGDPPAFAASLSFSSTDLPALRAKRQYPAWQTHVALLEERARAAMAHDPEAQLSDYAPFTDERYTRQWERGRWNYYHEGPLVAFVGLLNQDPEMLRWAARTLMCMVHTTYWCQSAESRLRGSTWDQRCFVEEMMTSAVAQMADWLDCMLTDRARELVHQALWDKGLAVIERDMMKWEYLYHCNQGPWFCRARLLGGLLLERAWPRLGDYVERALNDLRGGMDHYVLPDGGTDEGLGYWSLTMHMVLQGLIAYTRDRQCDVRTLLPSRQSETFLRIMSAVQPGRVLMDGDNSTDYLVGDTIPILAGLYPGSAYEQIVGACLLREHPFTYFNTYALDGLFGFIHGPEIIPAPRPIVPPFGRLTHTGHLTSYRTYGQHSTRLHLSGCKAHPGHSHFDKSGFTLELDGHPCLIDRGIVRYDDPRGEAMKASFLHNILTPILPDGTYAKQEVPTQPVIPQGEGDCQRLHATIDASTVWSTLMHACVRRLDSDTPTAFTITDEGELKTPGLIAFHLQSATPFVIEGKHAIVEQSACRLLINLDWADTVSQAEDGIDFAFQPVYHLVARSHTVTTFRFITTFSREDA